MPRFSKKRIIGIMVVMQSILCLACLPAWFVGCTFAALRVSTPGLFSEDEATFLMVLITVACISVAVLIYDWNKRVNMILWTLLVMGPGAMSLANLVSKPKSYEGPTGKDGMSTFLDLPKWCWLSLLLIFLFACTLFTPLINVIATIFFYALVTFVVVYMVMMAAKHVRLPYGAG